VAAAAPVVKEAAEGILTVYSSEVQDYLREGLYEILSKHGQSHALIHAFLLWLGRQKTTVDKLPGLAKLVTKWLVGQKIFGSEDLADEIREFFEHAAEAFADAARAANGQDPKFVHQKMVEASVATARAVMEKPWRLDAAGKGHYEGCKCVSTDSPSVSRQEAHEKKLELGACCVPTYRKEAVVARIRECAKRGALREPFEVYGGMTDGQRGVWDAWYGMQPETIQDIAWGLLPHFSTEEELHGFIKAPTEVKTKRLLTLKQQVDKKLSAMQAAKASVDNLIRADKRRGPQVAQARNEARTEWAKPYRFSLKRVLLGL
jgi:hypothetical protein